MKRKSLSLKQRNQWLANQRENLNKICYPAKFSEFEVQAELWSRMNDDLQLSRWFEVRGGVPARCKIGNHAPRAYLDLVVFRDKQAVVIIECKNGKGDSLCLTPGCRQDRRYSKFGLPVLQCPNMDAIEAVIKRVRELVAELLAVKELEAESELPTVEDVQAIYQRDMKKETEV